MRMSEYLKDRIFSLMCMFVSMVLLFALLWLIGTATVFVLFAEVVFATAYVTSLTYDFIRKRGYYKLLLKMLEQMEEKTLLGELLSHPGFLEGQLLIEVLRRCNKYQNDRIAAARQDTRE